MWAVFDDFLSEIMFFDEQYLFFDVIHDIVIFDDADDKLVFFDER
jgi:hypothetical protein